jgi:DNA-binding FadR family transcriptional regulator
MHTTIAIRYLKRSVGCELNTLVGRTVEQIKGMIESDGLLPGDKLPTLNQLAVDFGVSRTVIREAVISLSSDGVLESRHGVGVFIVQKDEEKQQHNLTEAVLSPISMIKASFMDLLELRMAFEVHAAGLAASRRSWAQESSIWDAANILEAAINNEDALDECDANFHRAIAEATNNSAFMEFFDLVGARITPRPAFTKASAPSLITPEYLQQTVREHRAICEAISAQDPLLAQEAMRAHLQRGHRRYRSMMETSQAFSPTHDTDTAPAPQES